MAASGRRRARALREAAIATVVATTAAFLFAMLLPESAQPFHRAGFLIVLGAMIASGWRGGLAGGLLGGAVGLTGIVLIFLFFGGPLGDVPIRVMVGLTIGAFGLALATLIGHVRGREMRALEKEHSAARELEAANRSLREANEALEAFAFLVSHDLKEPVRALEARLGAFVEDYGEDASVPASARELVRDARAANVRLHRLLHGLLDLSRASRIEPHDLKAVSIAEVVASDACVARYDELVRERGGRVEVVAPVDVRVLAQDAGLSQALGNLIANALRHHPAAGGRVRIAAARGAEGVVEIAVEDDGDGFQSSVIHAFDRGALPSSTNGSGFGLVIARRAIQRMGGAMSLERSRDLGGAAVRIRLPAA